MLLNVGYFSALTLYNQYLFLYVGMYLQMKRNVWELAWMLFYLLGEHDSCICINDIYYCTKTIRIIVVYSQIGCPGLVDRLLKNVVISLYTAIHVPMMYCALCHFLLQNVRKHTCFVVVSNINAWVHLNNWKASVSFWSTLHSSS